MGYTHYYRQYKDFTPDEWQEITAVLDHMLNHLPAHSSSAGGYFVDEPLAIDNRSNGDLLMFNGRGQLGHEDFYLERQGRGFQFCKTERKPYDLIVCAMLLAISEIAPAVLDVNSDGDMRGDEWQPAREFLRTLPPLPQPEPIEVDIAQFLQEVENVS